uniref:Suppressor of white apricot N-terminal domain-containing protein n=1 Tax=Oncorhynchus tshawytscha TaxID=74940 RepID=A0A8C8I684_ONCTS
MWQEARKHERKLRGMMVDYKRRGERRREYYEKIKKDPAQFLQVHGRAYKIHLDSAVALAAESPVNMMPWQGDANNMIDRFDVRAHLDFILTYTPPLLNTATPEQELEERKCNYERYRGLVQNDFASISEEQCLYQIQMDELYGGLQRPNEDEKKKLAKEKATIGYTYEDSTVTKPGEEEEKGEEDDSDNSESEEDEGIPDIDVEVDVDELNTEQELDLNKMATPYGMAEGDFVRMLRKDKDELEAIKHAKALEAEKAMYSGRRSRRQRREFREKRLKGRQISPPRPQSESSSESRSRSRSPGPEKITFITSFGGSDEEAAAAIQAPPPVHTPANSLHQPAGHSRGSRRRRSSSSPSSSSTHSSTHRSSSRSSSHSRRDRRRGGGRDRRHSRSRSRRRSDSRSRGRGANGGGRGGSRRRCDRTQSRSNDRDGDRERDRERDRDVGRCFVARKRTRSRSNSRQGDRARRGGGGRTLGGHQRGVSSSSPSPSQSPQPSCTPSPSHRGGPPSATALCDKLRKPDTPGGKETGAAKPRMTPQEKLKIRMQKALNRQCDKTVCVCDAALWCRMTLVKRWCVCVCVCSRERERREKERDEWERQYGRQSHSPSPSKYGESPLNCHRC